MRGANQLSLHQGDPASGSPCPVVPREPVTPRETAASSPRNRSPHQARKLRDGAPLQTPQNQGRGRGPGARGGLERCDTQHPSRSEQIVTGGAGRLVQPCHHLLFGQRLEVGGVDVEAARRELFAHVAGHQLLVQVGSDGQLCSEWGMLADRASPSMRHRFIPWWLKSNRRGRSRVPPFG